MAKKAMTFEAAMERLEEILHTLESGGEALDATLKLYEEGVGLIRICSEKLEHAEQSVKLLQMQADGSVSVTDFNQAEEA